MSDGWVDWATDPGIGQRRWLVASFPNKILLGLGRKETEATDCRGHYRRATNYPESQHLHPTPGTCSLLRAQSYPLLQNLPLSLWKLLPERSPPGPWERPWAVADRQASTKAWPLPVGSG